VYSTSGNQPKQLATSIAQKWLTKEFAAGTKTGARPDALVWSGLLPGPGNTYMCVMSVPRLYNVTPWLQSHWCA
jgi:hypothetical protein